MLYCDSCKKEVVIYGVMYTEESKEGLDKLIEKIEEEGKLILFNPPPVGPYECPICFTKLEEKMDNIL